MAERRIRALQKNENLIVIPIGIGKDADRKTLSELANGEEVINIFEVDFKKLFEVLSDSADDNSKLMDGTAFRPNINKLMKDDNFNDEPNMSDTWENEIHGEYFVFGDDF